MGTIDSRLITLCTISGALFAGILITSFPNLLEAQQFGPKSGGTPPIIKMPSKGSGACVPIQNATRQNEDKSPIKNKEVNITKHLETTRTLEELERKKLLIPTIEVMASVLSQWNNKFPKEDGELWLLDAVQRTGTMNALMIPLLEMYQAMNLSGYSEEAKGLGSIFQALNPKLATEMEKSDLISFAPLNRAHPLLNFEQEHNSLAYVDKDLNNIKSIFKEEYFVQFIYGEGSLFSKNEPVEKENRRVPINMRNTDMVAMTGKEAACKSYCTAEYFKTVGKGVGMGAAVGGATTKHPAGIAAGAVAGGIGGHLSGNADRKQCSKNCTGEYGDKSNQSKPPHPSERNPQGDQIAGEKQKKLDAEDRAESAEKQLQKEREQRLLEDRKREDERRKQDEKRKQENDKRKQEEDERKRKEKEAREDQINEDIKNAVNAEPKYRDAGCGSCDNTPHGQGETMVGTPKPPFMDDDKPSPEEVERRNRLRQDMMVRKSQMIDDKNYDGLTDEERRKKHMDMVNRPLNPNMDKIKLDPKIAAQCSQEFRDAQINTGNPTIGN